MPGEDGQIGSVGVFCGSSPGFDPRWAIAAEVLGRTLAAEGLRLVYGGDRPAWVEARRRATEHPHRSDLAVFARHAALRGLQTGPIVPL